MSVTPGSQYASSTRGATRPCGASNDKPEACLLAPRHIKARGTASGSIQSGQCGISRTGAS